ncbi:hypothetical protein [Nonomuraea rhizosphaerae]|uniref:hypothetical protein n=1 Tax=Nonomuraea rhizosphaerae TaxID=2665663 RepID=UPI001C5E1241|nr:hypothetical protein [Nonomuraea rhizosphaerae]
MRSVLIGTAVLALSAFAVPADASTTKVAYGWAWRVGGTELRITPMTAAYRRPHYTFHPIRGAKELRLDYSKAAYRRVTVACDLKETEGRVAVDRKGLGTTACKPRDLSFTLDQSPTSVRVEYRGSKAVKVSELFANTPRTRSVRGTIKRIDDSTLLFTGQGTKIKLGYTWVTTFHRTTKGCGDGWLSGRPVNADRNGLGKKTCRNVHLTAALKNVRHPVLVKLDYTPDVNQVHDVWEVFGDA